MEVTVETNNLRKAATQIRNARISMGIAALEVDAVALAMRGMDDNFAMVADRLRGYADDINRVSSKAGRLKSGALTIAGLYEKADLHTVRGKHPNISWKQIGKTLGPVISKTMTHGKVAKIAVKGADLLIKKAMGREAIYKGTEYSLVKPKWYEIWKRKRFKIVNLKQYVGDFAHTKITSKANWAAEVLASGWDNYREHGGFTSRFFEETAVEGGIGVGEGIVGGAAAAGIIAFAGVSAPAWAVAAGGTVIVIGGDWLLDKGVQLVTGDPKAEWKEIASDKLCDHFEQGVHRIKDTGKAIKKGWNHLVGAFSGNGSSCKWGMVSHGAGGR